MIFNPARTKQAKEVLFSRKTSKSSRSCLYLSNATMKVTSLEKHFGLSLKWNWCLLLKFQLNLTRRSLMIIYKSFISLYVRRSDKDLYYEDTGL